MRIQEILEENGTAGGTTSGAIASIANPGGPMMPMIRRMPPGQSFFAPMAAKPKKKPPIGRKKTSRDK